MTGLCQCGCGLPAPLARQSATRRGYVKGQPHRFIAGHGRRKEHPVGYRQRYAPDRPGKTAFEHVLIAEQALGKPLPNGVEIHHVNEDRHDNAHANLVICQDKAFHKLLHVRTRVLRAGGNPNTDKICTTCRLVKPLTAFNRWNGSKSTGRQSQCRACAKARHKARREARSAA